MQPRALVRPFVCVALATLVFTATPPRPADAEDTPGGGPRLVVDQMEHDFGNVGQEQELEATFSYRNAGAARLEGIRAIGDCGCYGVVLTADALDPGASGTLTVKFRTLMFNGLYKKKLKLLTTNGPRKPVVIALHVNVVAGVIISPGRIWFKDVLVGSSPSKTIYAKWHKEAGAPFKVTGVEVPGHDFQVETAPYEQGDWEGTAITFGFKQAPPLGMFSATALVRTDNPDYPRISLPITAHVTGKVWVQSRTIYFGWIPKGASKRSTVMVRPFDKTVDLGTVSAKARDGRVDVTVDPDPMGREGYWRVTVKVPEDADPGEVDDVVEILTSVPGEEKTEIEVRGKVLDIER